MCDGKLWVNIVCPRIIPLWETNVTKRIASAKSTSSFEVGFNRHEAK